jgi:hypothetical protein
MSAIFGFPVSGWGQRLAKKRADREEQHRVVQESACLVQQWNEARRPWMKSDTREIEWKANAFACVNGVVDEPGDESNQQTVQEQPGEKRRPGLEATEEQRAVIAIFSSDLTRKADSNRTRRRQRRHLWIRAGIAGSSCVANQSMNSEENWSQPCRANFTQIFRECIEWIPKR